MFAHSTKITSIRNVYCIGRACYFHKFVVLETENSTGEQLIRTMLFHYIFLQNLSASADITYFFYLFVLGICRVYACFCIAMPYAVTMSEVYSDVI